MPRFSLVFVFVVVVIMLGFYILLIAAKVIPRQDLGLKSNPKLGIKLTTPGLQSE